MQIDFKKKRLIYNDGSYVYWGIKKKKFFFKNKKELEMNVSIVSYMESKIETLEKVIEEHQDFEKDLQKYTRILQEKCGIEPGSFCEIKSLNGDKKYYLRRGKKYEEINI